MTERADCGPGAGTHRVSFLAVTLHCLVAGFGAGMAVAALLACITLLLA